MFLVSASASAASQLHGQPQYCSLSAPRRPATAVRRRWACSGGQLATLPPCDSSRLTDEVSASTLPDPPRLPCERGTGGPVGGRAGASQTVASCGLRSEPAQKTLHACVVAATARNGNGNGIGSSRKGSRSRCMDTLCNLLEVVPNLRKEGTSRKRRRASSQCLTELLAMLLHGEAAASTEDQSPD